jgi:Tic22-like family
MLTAIATLALFGQGTGAKSSPLMMDDIKKRFTIPVFIVASAADQPLTAQGKDNKAYMNVFFGKQECDEFVAAIRKQNKINNISTRVMSLADVVGIPGAEKWFVPMQAELKYATELLRKTDPKAKEFAHTPLFYLEAKTGYVTIVQGGKTAIPFFFSFKSAEALYKKALESKVQDPKLKVTSFEQVYETLKTQPTSQTEQIQFVVHPEAIAQYNNLKGG